MIIVIISIIACMDYIFAGCNTLLENAVYKEVTKLKKQEMGVVDSEEERQEPLSCIRRAQVSSF